MGPKFCQFDLFILNRNKFRGYAYEYITKFSEVPLPPLGLDLSWFYNLLIISHGRLIRMGKTNHAAVRSNPHVS